MRKGIIAGAMLCFFLLGGGPLVAQERSGATKAIWLVDDFEDGNAADWYGPEGPCFKNVTSSDAANGTSWSLKINGPCVEFGGLWKKLGIAQPTTMTFWVKGDPSKKDAVVVLGDEDVTSNGGAVYFLADSNGQFTLKTDTSDYLLGSYINSQWYRIDLSFDWIGRTVDVDIDGEPRQRNVPFRAPATVALTRIHFFNVDDSAGWLDQISMVSPPPSLNLFGDGFESADTTEWSGAVPAQPQRLVLFDGGGAIGPLGGRQGADLLCGIAAESTVGIPAHATTRAFISVSASDEIRDMPVKYGVPTGRLVTGPNWSVIAADWADLLDGSLAMDLFAAGVQTFHDYWYSGSLADGSVSSYTCSGWTDGSTPSGGRYGSVHVTSSAWINLGSGLCGECTYHVLCLAWR